MGVCNCSMFCCTLLYVHSSIAIILMGKRELVALLNLFSWFLVMVKRLFLAVPRGCLQFVIVVFPDHTHYFSGLGCVSGLCGVGCSSGLGVMGCFSGPVVGFFSRAGWYSKFQCEQINASRCGSCIFTNIILTFCYRFIQQNLLHCRPTFCSPVNVFCFQVTEFAWVAKWVSIELFSSNCVYIYINLSNNNQLAF